MNRVKSKMIAKAQKVKLGIITEENNLKPK